MNTRQISTAFLLPLALLATGTLGAREAGAQRGRASIPAETVVHVELEQRVSSREARTGDRVTATVTRRDRSGLPPGTRFEGVVTEVQRAGEDRPGIVDMHFRRAVLPGGEGVPVSGVLASLAAEDVRRAPDGRLESRRREDRERFDPKWVGYGAGAGAVLAVLFKDSVLRGALLGGLGGAIFGLIKKDRKGRDEFREVELTPGTEFGIRLTRPVAIDSRERYRPAPREDYRREDRVAGAREEYRYGDTLIALDGRRVDLTPLRPVNVNGVLYVPLAPVARAAGMRFVHEPGDEFFTLHTPDGPAEAYAGETTVTVRGRRSEPLEAAALSLDGEIYVPTEFFTRVAGMRVDWDRRGRRLELESYR